MQAARQAGRQVGNIQAGGQAGRQAEAARQAGRYYTGSQAYRQGAATPPTKRSSEMDDGRWMDDGRLSQRFFARRPKRLSDYLGELEEGVLLVLLELVPPKRGEAPLDLDQDEGRIEQHGARAWVWVGVGVWASVLWVSV